MLSKPLVALIGVGWLTALFVLIRIVVPSLVNSQNDGLLILAYLLPVGFGWVSYNLYRFLKENIA